MDKETSSKNPSWLALLFAKDQVKRSLVMSFIVGTILNLINQGHLLTSPEQINIINILLTYAVPYCVSSIAAAQSKAQFIKEANADKQVKSKE